MLDELLRPGHITKMKNTWGRVLFALCQKIICSPAREPVVVIVAVDGFCIDYVVVIVVIVVVAYC